MQEYGTKLVLAGGFIRSCVSGEKINDIDLFPASESLGKEMALKLTGGKGEHIYATGNAYTVSRRLPYSVQFIHRWLFENPSEIVRSFDFSIAQSAIWFDPFGDGSKEDVSNGGFGRWHSLCADQFYADLAAKRLVYLRPDRNEDAGGSMLRVLKFYQRGYRIPIDSLGSVIARLVNGVDLDKITVKESDIESSIGKTPEQRWARVLTGLLHEVDPAIDPAHLSHLPAQDVQPKKYSDEAISTSALSWPPPLPDALFTPSTETGPVQ